MALCGAPASRASAKRCSSGSAKAAVLPVPGPCLADGVAAREQDGDEGLLDGGGRVVAEVGHGLGQLAAELEVGKRHEREGPASGQQREAARPGGGRTEAWDAVAFQL